MLLSVYRRIMTKINIFTDNSSESKRIAPLLEQGINASASHTVQIRDIAHVPEAAAATDFSSSHAKNLDQDLLLANAFLFATTWVWVAYMLYTLRKAQWANKHNMVQPVALCQYSRNISSQRIPRMKSHWRENSLELSCQIKLHSIKEYRIHWTKSYWTV